MNIKKAVITAAGRNQNRLPLQVLVDSDGTQKSAVRIIFDEVMSAGIDQIGLVISPADQEAYETALEEVPARLQFITQAVCSHLNGSLRQVCTVRLAFSDREGAVGVGVVRPDRRPSSPKHRIYNDGWIG